MDSNSELQHQAQLMKPEPPHYYEVRDEHGKRYCHCGSKKDAINVWKLHMNFSYEKIYFTPSQTVDVPYVILEPDQQLPTRDIVVNMDGGVGGSWKEVSDEEFDVMFPDQKLSTQQSLPENQQQPLDL